jgi:nicotinate-nucleotide adenylyltransferase
VSAEAGAGGGAGNPEGAGERRIGVLGSAFNPPHLGHLVLAQESAAQLGLAEVLLVPTGEAPHKEIEDDPGREVRLEMVRLAAGTDERLGVSEVETRHEGPSYTYRTLELLQEERPEGELVLLMGTDAAAGLGEWRSPERIVELARLAVARRHGAGRREVEAVLERLGGIQRADFVEMPEIGVSSTMVRQRVAEGRPIRYLVPEAVATLIVERGLYAREREPAG